MGQHSSHDVSLSSVMCSMMHSAVLRRAALHESVRMHACTHVCICVCIQTCMWCDVMRCDEKRYSTLRYNEKVLSCDKANAVHYMFPTYTVQFYMHKHTHYAQPDTHAHTHELLCLAFFLTLPLLVPHSSSLLDATRQGMTFLCSRICTAPITQYMY